MHEQGLTTEFNWNCQSFIELNFSLVKLQFDSPLIWKKRYKILKQSPIFRITDPESQFLNQNDLNRYTGILMDSSRNDYKSLDLSNFLMDGDKSFIASKDLRSMIKDFKGNIPMDVMHNCASVALLTAIGLIPQNQGIAYITKTLKSYGKIKAHLEYSGYVSITVGEDPDVHHRSSFSITGKGGSG